MRKQPACRFIESAVAWVELADGNEYAVPRCISITPAGLALGEAFDAMKEDSRAGADVFSRACLRVFYPADADALVDGQAVGWDAVVAMINAVTGQSKKNCSVENSTGPSGE